MKYTIIVPEVANAITMLDALRSDGGISGKGVASMLLTLSYLITGLPAVLGALWVG